MSDWQNTSNAILRFDVRGKVVTVKARGRVSLDDDLDYVVEGLRASLTPIALERAGSEEPPPATPAPAPPPADPPKGRKPPPAPSSPLV